MKNAYTLNVYLKGGFRLSKLLMRLFPKAELKTMDSPGQTA